MCEGLARKMPRSRADVESAGTDANGSSANPHAIEIMRSRFGIDISSHRSRNVKDVSVDDFDYVVALDGSVSEVYVSGIEITDSLPWSLVVPVFHEFSAG
jgi:protein-tyrosine-phosphatase